VAGVPPSFFGYQRKRATKGGHATTYRSFGEGGDDGDGKVTFSGAVGVTLLAVAVQNDGKILIAGQYSSIDDSETLNRIRYAFVGRLGQNGKLDKTFGDDGIAKILFSNKPGENEGAVFLDMVIQPDGRIVAVGARIRQSTRYDTVIARLNTRGRLDKSFDDDGFTVIDMGGKMDLARRRTSARQAHRRRHGQRWSAR